VAGDEVGLGYQVGLLDDLGSEAEMADGVGAGLLGVVDEVALGAVVGLVADDLDGVLVGAYGAVGTQAEEEAFLYAVVLQFEVSSQGRLVPVTSS
jgi:hypothetical protein